MLLPVAAQKRTIAELSALILWDDLLMLFRFGWTRLARMVFRVHRYRHHCCQRRRGAESARASDLGDATGAAVAATRADEPVLVGAAILGALAGKHFTNVAEAMKSMSVLAPLRDRCGCCSAQLQSARRR